MKLRSLTYNAVVYPKGFLLQKQTLIWDLVQSKYMALTSDLLSAHIVTVSRKDNKLLAQE